MMERQISANNNFGHHETSSVNTEPADLVIQIKYSVTWLEIFEKIRQNTQLLSKLSFSKKCKKNNLLSTSLLDK